MIITLAAAGGALVLVGVLGICQAARCNWDDDDALRDAGFSQDDIDRMHRDWEHHRLGRPESTPTVDLQECHHHHR